MRVLSRSVTAIKSSVMKLIKTLFLAIAVASVICNSHATSTTIGEEGGQPLHTPHVIGGVSAANEMYRPEVFRLKLFNNKELLRTCTGAELESPKNRFIWITVAECLDQLKYDKVVLEQEKNGKFIDHPMPLNKLKYHVHPKYDNVTKENNIAVITPGPNMYINKDPKSTQIQMPFKNDHFENKPAEIYLEWKQAPKEDGKDQRVEPYYIQTKVISPSWCKLWYPFSHIKNSHVCASGWYGKGLRKADIGTPLVSKGKYFAFQLVGIATVVRPWTSWFGLPIEFLSIEPYIDWIKGL